MDAERKAELRNSAENALAVHDEGSIEWVHASRLLEALDALDAAEARVNEHFECLNAALDKLHATEAERDRLREQLDDAEVIIRTRESERDRLREALEKIVIRDGWKGRMFHLAEAIKIAAEAINRPECRDDCEACQIEQDEVSDGR